MTSGVYDEIRRRIIEGGLAPGTPLTEAQLTDEYGVSRTPVRNALARLEQDGLLERVRSGYAIPVRSPDQIVDLFEARVVLELAVAERAASRRTVLDLARLHHLLERAAAAEPGELIHLNDAFHLAVREAAHNSAFLELAGRVDAQLAPYEALPAAVSDDREVTQEEHRRMLEAIVAGDPVQARAATEVHVHRSRDIRIAALARVD